MAQEFGLGALQSPGDDRDFPVEPLLAGVLMPPASYLVPRRPPVLNQGASPMCVAYSTSALKSYQDRDDVSPVRWFDFDEPLFFRQIGGSASGAYLRTALDRLLKAGYPLVTGGQADKHRIRAYYAVPNVILTIQRALMELGVLVAAMPWYHSWMKPHPTSYILPRPDYQIGGHAILVDGWNDVKGLRLRNSWGSSWGDGGDCFLPYSYARTLVWEYWKAVDTAAPVGVTLTVGEEVIHATTTDSPVPVTLAIGGEQKYRQEV